MITIRFEKHFLKQLNEILQNKKSFGRVVQQLINQLKQHAIGPETAKWYDIKKLSPQRYRIKIPPHRIILYYEETTKQIIFDAIFKRKGDNDYKQRN